MNQLSQLQTVGIELPSMAYFIGAVLFGLVGMVAWRHGGMDGVPAAPQ